MMEKSIRTTLKNKVTASRLLLEKSVIDRLQGYYGIHQSGLIEDSKLLSHLAAEDQEYRSQLLISLDHIRASGLKMKDALEQLIREVAFTHLNRLCAYKLMEARGLIRESVSKGIKSQGFFFYLADHPEDEALANVGDTEKAYRHFLRWLSGTLSEELGALFTPDDPADRLYPPLRVLDQVLELLNAEELKTIWTEDETIGWVYQYFTPKELRDKSHKESRAPRNSYEMAFRNQFYTPRYVVEFLTDNTLGRTWYEMRQGNTGLVETCRYLVRRPNEVWLKEGEDVHHGGMENTEIEKTPEELLKEQVTIPFRALKDPRDLKILDPACGSGHFLLYCFDLLERIYAEAWQDCPQVFTDLRGELSDAEFLRRVPGMILRHNLHGIDIDLRATQIASLALWLRAQKTYQALGLRREERPKITRANIVCAEPMPGEPELLEEFCQGLQPPLIGQLVKTIFEKMKLAGEAGSLLKIEQELEEAIQAAKAQMDAQPQAEQLDFWPAAPRPKQMAFDLRSIAKSDAEFWQTVEKRVLEALQEYAARAVNGQGYRRKLFTGDTAQGLAFVDVCRRRYDVILMNPPFGEPSAPSKSYVEEKYKRTKGDVLANFVERTLELSKPRGKIGAITNRTPFFLTSQAAFRQQVLQKEGFIEVMADLGAGVLEAMVETATYTFSPAQPPNRESSFIRCLMVPDKQDLILQSVTNLSKGQPTGNVFFINPDEFARIEGAPYCYWISTRTIRQVSKHPKLEGNYGTVRVGLQTGDDWRFLRNAWEIPSTLIGPSPRHVWDKEEIQEVCAYEFKHGRKWAFFSKTDSALPWFSPLTLVVNWEKDGDEIKNFMDEKGKLRSRPQNLEFYFRPGFSYMLRSTRIVPYIVPSSVIPTAGRAQVYPEINNEYALIGYCASQVASAIARFNGENFGQPKFQASMIQNLPTPEIAPILLNHIKELIESEFNQRKITAIQYEPYQEFSIPAILGNNGFNGTDWSRFSLLGPDLELAVAQSMGLDAEQLKELARDIRESLEMQYSSSQTDEDYSDEESSEDDLATVQFIEDSEKTRNEELVSYLVGLHLGRWDARFALHPELIPDLPGAFDPLPVCPPASLVNVDGLPAFKGQIVSEAWLRARPDATTLPETVSDHVVGKDGQLYPATIPDEEYPIRVTWDGILVDDPDHPDDIVTRSHDVLELLFPGRGEAVEQETCQVLGVKTLREYFRKPGTGGFWMDHVKRYSKSRRKAPIYWLLQSSRKNFALWLYYHRLDKDLLFKALTQYVEPKIRLEEEHLKTLRAQRGTFGTGGRQAKELDQAMERQEDLLIELEDFRDKLRRAADLGLEPDLNDGVVLNIAPLWELVPWNEAKKYWQELLEGKYEWSSIGKQLRAKGLVK
ncbi:MAG TPA: BREX-1 system adenine-specific DNA-methyltransferase PglX [Anaerolineaceae bacterium]|nr:BREX-1 system adenine-specific DNA-methyltransferase PglX [Anaerolineaceae bacterium]